MAMSNKGATRMDKIAHALMEFNADGLAGAVKEDFRTAFYHEERLYSVRDCRHDTLTLVYASSPHEAIGRAKKSGVDWDEYQRLERYEKQYNTEAGIIDPLEPLKISSALDSEIRKWEYRVKHDRSQSVYWIIRSFPHCRRR